MGVNCGSQVVLCDLPIHFDTYKGCSHACKYCFVQRKTTLSNIEKDNCIKALENFISGKRTSETNFCDWNIPLHWGGMSDPFQPCEKKERVSYRALQLFAKTKYPFVVSTKGKLIADDEYLSLIKECNCVVQISMVCSRYDILEKGAPTYEERLEMCRKVSPVAKRVIVRFQPYMLEVHEDLMKTLPKLKEAGVYGVTVEGMKFFKKKAGLVKVGGDYCYPVELLKPRYEEIKKECHRLGLAFFCAENRLRTMGDDMCCCGIVGLEGFTPNRNNTIHILTDKKMEFTSKEKAPDTGGAYKSLFQSAGYSKFIKGKSYEEMTKFVLQTKADYLKEIFGLENGK